MNFLEKCGIEGNSLIAISSLPKIDIKNITNGLVTELHTFAILNGLPLLDYFCKWLSELTDLTLNEINTSAVMSKLNRTLNSMKKKRGELKSAYLNETFVIPVQTSAYGKTSIKSPELAVLGYLLKKSVDIIETKKTELDDTNKKLKERRGVVVKVRQTVKQLKRKLDSKECALQQNKAKIVNLEKSNSEILNDNKRKSKEIGYLKGALAKSKVMCNTLRASLNNVRGSESQLRWQVKLKDQEVNLCKVRLQENEDIVKSAKDTEKQLKEALDSVDYLTALLHDTPVISLFDNERNMYTTAAVESVMNLTDLKVPVERVGEVIKTVAALCGKNVDRVPSATTVNRIVDSKLAVAQKHICSVLTDKPNTTLYTDETRKYGKSMQTYLVTDEDQKSYIIGLREMVDKSGLSILETLKDILSDISTYCYQKEQENDINVGYKLLANIRDTMSDRASTEKYFNVLLEQYRTEVLPHVYQGWDDLNDTEKEKVTHMNNFFCGLHLLVGMADVCENTVKKFEKNYLDGQDVGASVRPELKKYQKNESGTLRLIRTASKAFAVGQDEKNGVSLPWQTYLNSFREKNRIVRFKHNRFNLTFSLALSVYHHREAISEFLDQVHGTGNDLLKAVSLDIKEHLYLAGLKAFGLISKLITGPLWKLLESGGHVLEMNVKYKELVDFLLKGANDVDFISKFVDGVVFPFETVIGDDPQTTSLLEQNDQLTEILYPLLQALFLSMHELLCRMVADHLPGGKFDQESEILIEETRSVMKHNKLPEFVFGQLDQLLRYRPNATLLTNEAYLMYSHNKSRLWLAELKEEEKERLLESCLKEGKVIRKMFKVRLREIDARRIEIQEKRKQELEEKEKKRVIQLENMTQDVCDYGLWQSVEQMDEGLGKLETESQRRNALQVQLRFRKNVLKQKHSDRQVYNFSVKDQQGKYMKHTVAQLKQNVSKLIQDTLATPTHEQENYGIPLLVGKNIEHTFSDGNGKKMYKGKVISVVPGFNQWYNVKYQNDCAIYAYNLQEDYRAGDLKIAIQSTQTD